MTFYRTATEFATAGIFEGFNRALKSFHLKRLIFVRWSLFLLFFYECKEASHYIGFTPTDFLRYYFSEFEASFLRLLDKLTNGTVIKINETGTVLNFQPGLLIGGKVDHNCSLQRSIGYYLEAMCFLAPFCKKPLDLTLRGITNDKVRLSLYFTSLNLTGDMFPQLQEHRLL